MLEYKLDNHNDDQFMAKFDLFIMINKRNKKMPVILLYSQEKRY